MSTCRDNAFPCIAFILMMSQLGSPSRHTAFSLWKIGLFRSLYRDGFGDRAGPYVYQLLSDEEASMGVRTGRPYHFTNLQTVYDLNEVGCDVEFHHLCMEFTQGDSPSPWYNLTIVSITGSAVLCTEIPCFGRTGPGVDRRCRLPCPEDEPVCGNDGITYPSSCEVDNLIRCLSRDVTIAYYGECRIGVIMESMFWSASVVDNEPGELTELEMEAFLFANESSESVAGTNLWRMGVFGSMNVDGTGPKFGYVPQILDETAASQVLVSGLPLPIRARFHFDVATIGCNEFDFMCMEFTRDNAAEPFFPFQTNSGKDTFTSCRVAPCDPLASLNRMAVGPVTWGITVATFRRSAPSDIVLDVLVQITPDSELIQGNGLWRIGLFGSPLANGSSSDRFNYVRQLLDPALASLPITPGQKINFPALPAQFKIIELGCSRYKYICLEIAKGDEPQPDFVFHNDQQKPLIFCKSVSCPGPPKPVVRLLSLDWNLGLITHRIGSPSNVSITVSIATSERSSPVNGTDLWKLGFFTSGDANGVGGRRGQYKEQILSQADSSHPIIPGMPLNFVNVLTSIDITGMGCAGSNFSYTCISFAKGDAADPDFDLPLRNDEAVSCKRIACQAAQSQRSAIFQATSVTWEYLDDSSAIKVRMRLIPDTGHETISGRNLWEMGVYASDPPENRNPTKYGYVENILDGRVMGTTSYRDRELELVGSTPFEPLNRYLCSDSRPRPYLCVEVRKNPRAQPPFSLLATDERIRQCNLFNCHDTSGNIEGLPSARFSSMQWMLTPILDLGSRRAAQSVRIQLIVMPEAGTDYIHGSGLWRVGLFSSGQRDGRGVRHQYVRQILNEYETSRELTVSLPLRFDLNTDFNMEGIGCGDTRYICIEFTKGDRPRPNFNLPMTNNHFINCHLYRCKNSDPRPTRAPRPRPRPRPNPNPTPTSNQGPDRGPRPVSNQNSHLKTARLTNFRWNMQPVTYRDAMSSDINLRAWITPSPTTDFIHGVNLWRLGIFGNSLQTGKGPKVGYRRQVLPLRDANAPMHAAAPLEFEIPMQFELWRVGCNDIGFLCVEFAKGDSPDPNFNFPLPGGGAVVSCQRATCLQGRSSAVSVNVANYRSMRASYGVESAPGERAVPIRVNLMVTPGDSTKTITGNRLWKVSAFGSASPDGSGSRRSEIPNILDSESQRVSMRPSQEMTLSGDVGLPLAEHVGCRPGYEYLCLEFARGDNPTMTFSMNSNVMCRQMDCQPVGDTSRRPNTGNTGSTGHTGNTGSSGNTGNAADTARWQRMGANLQGLGSDTIGASLEIHPHDTTSRITGSDLWRVGAFGSSNREGTGSRKGQIRNILDDRAMRTSMVPRRPITLSGDIGTPLSRRLGCLRGYEYLCLEFDKGDRPSMPFNMESGIMCQEMPSINCDTSDTGHEVESGTVARWSQIAPGYRRNRNRVTATVDVTPHPDTDLIHGNNLWRVGVFGSERSDGSGRRNGEVRDILDYSGRGRTLQPPRGSNQNIIELSGSFNFPDGCTRGYRYLCIEFDKSENPSMDFSMSRPDPGCMEQQCDGPRVDPGGSGTSGGSGGSHTGSSGGSHGDTSVEITGLSWAPVRSRGSNFFDSAEATVNLNFEPGPTFEGSNLWRMGVFASPDSEGQRDRQDETEQILSSADRSRTIQQRRGNTFQISNPRVNISDAGCEGKIYLCFEFGQARNPNPSFSISGPHGNGQTRISCKRQTCRITKSVYVMKVTPTSSNPQIVAQDDNDVRFNVEVRFDRPRTMSITGTDLWRMEAWASNTNRASGRKLSHSTQILNSDFVRDTVVTKGTDSSRIGDFSFTNLEHRIDMRPDVTCKQVKFLCVKLHKDNPHPDFELQVRDNNPDFLMGCLKLQCEGVNMTADLLSTSSPSRGIVHPTSLPTLHPSPLPSNQTAASEKMFVVNNIGISREVNSAVQSGRNNDMLLNLNVVHDRGTSTEVTGQPGWAVQAWGSSKKNGKKAKISPANLNLGAERQQNFDRRTPVRFNRIPYTLDLNDGCQNVKYLCVKLSKTGPGFTLKGRPNSKALTSCTALTCMGDQGSTPSRNTGRGQGAGQAAERPRVEWESLATNMNYPVTTGEVKVTMDATMGFTANSGVPSGPGLWHMAVYGSREDSDSTHDKFGYTGNILTPKQAKTRIAPGRSTTISGISFRMDMSRIGCAPYYFFCIEYGKGTSDSYDMAYPRNDRGVSCERRECN